MPLLHLRRLTRLLMVLMTGEKGLLAVMSGAKGSFIRDNLFLSVIIHGGRAAQQIAYFRGFDASGHYGLFVTCMLNGVTHAYDVSVSGAYPGGLMPTDFTPFNGRALFCDGLLTLRVGRSRIGQ